MPLLFKGKKRKRKKEREGKAGKCEEIWRLERKWSSEGKEGTALKIMIMIMTSVKRHNVESVTFIKIVLYCITVDCRVCQNQREQENY